MKTLDTQKGFTLVELAIVMTIIGLLIGGILKGQELMQNARVTSTVAQVKSYEAALTSFRDEYQAYPGDLTSGSTRVKGCTTACDSANGGDNIVGDSTFDSSYDLSSLTTGASAAAGAATKADEGWLFWQEMMLANLTGGVTAEGVATAGTAYAWGITHPAAKIGGGFIAAYLTGANSLPGAPAAAVPDTGTYIALTTAPTDDMGTNAGTTGLMPLSPLRAAQIDRKMDDGKPDTGDVLGWGLTASCYGAAAPYSYIENTNASDCGLFFHIDG